VVQPWKLARLGALLLVGATLGVGAAAAQSLPEVSIHAAGGLAFGVTDGPNTYLSGTPENSWDLRDLSLTVLSTPTDRLLVGAQATWGVRNIFAPDQLQVNLAQAFAQYTVTDAFKVRAGVMRHPFALYSETLEIGTLRPFLNLPRGVYSPGTFEWDGYRGVGITGTLGKESPWPVEYDVYGGALATLGTDANPIFRSLSGNAPPTSGSTGGSDLRDMVGARLRLGTPVEGLVVAVASYTGVPETPLFTLPQVRQYAYLGSVEMVRDRWLLRGEYGRRDAGSGAIGQGAYVEASHRLGRHWEVAGRWDWFDVDLGPRFPLPPFLSSILEHRDVAAGLNYRVTDSLIVKASVHDVEGNFFAAPKDGLDFAAGETLDSKTRLLQVGAQFSF
jgi:hypothetical protein